MSGLHHVTAIAGDPIRNFGFYTRDLGLRFVKRTVNFDDPATYHFYYGDETGRPGTILTFFPWQGVPPGRRGVGETHQTAFRVPLRSLGYWTQRFLEKGIHYEALEKRFGESVLPFTDPDGMALALVGVPGAEDKPAWSNGDVPVEHAIRGFHGVTLLLDDARKTAAILTDVFGFKETDREGSVTRYEAAELQQAKERIGSLFGETGTETAPEGDAWVDAAIAALLEKACAKLDVVGDEDRRELIDLMEAVRDTQAADDPAALDQARGQLADLLFYLET